MSQENVERMRTAMGAFNRGDGDALDGCLGNDAEIVPVRAALEGTTYRGPDAGTQYCMAVSQSWEDLRWEVEELETARAGSLPWATFVARAVIAVRPLTRRPDGSPTSAMV